jgi:xylulose-5-phosphate/fructose-6-phosphate phosphoketolase
MTENALTADLLRKLDAYWRAANYLSVGQIYLHDNPLLKEPLTLAHVKHMLLGHWGTTPGQNFIYVHLNRVIKKYDLATAGRPSSATPTSKARTARSTRTSAKTRPGSRNFLRNSPFPAGFRAMLRPSAPDRSTKAASLATR